MLRILFFIAFVFTCANTLSVKKQPLITSTYVEELNKLPGMTWRASSVNGIVTGASKEEIMRFIGGNAKPLSQTIAFPQRLFTEKEKRMVIPTEFDAAANWPNCPTIRLIRDQSMCRADWAIASTSVISDRYCTTANKSIQVSAGFVLSCCDNCGDGCEGGFTRRVFDYWIKSGIVSEECQPYPLPRCAHTAAYGSGKGKYPPCPSQRYPTPFCESKCTGNHSEANRTRYKGKNVYTFSGEENFQRELMLNGPFEVAFSLYKDFLAYKSGVYQHVDGELISGQSARLIGWGVLNDVKYWKVANSWNEEWGLNGYFLIKRGTNECGIEMNGDAVIA